MAPNSSSSSVGVVRHGAEKNRSQSSALPTQSNPGTVDLSSATALTNAGICWSCLGLTPPTSTATGTGLGTATETGTSTSTGTSTATDTGTDTSTGTDTATATEVSTDTESKLAHSRGGGCTIFPPNPAICTPPLKPIIQWLNDGNYGYLVKGCTNGIPAQWCVMTYLGPFGFFSVTVLANGIWWYNGPAVSGIWPVVKWRCGPP